MTDKELLELAAKAADVKYDAEASKPHPKSGAFWGLWLVIDGEPSEYQRRYWNPLTDDGDALRLAVKLNLFNTRSKGYEWPDAELFARHEDDPYAATRRAITRAAAEIGKAMP
jgi:hypothetical protein